MKSVEINNNYIIYKKFIEREKSFFLLLNIFNKNNNYFHMEKCGKIYIYRYIYKNNESRF